MSVIFRIVWLVCLDVSFGMLYNGRYLVISGNISWIIKMFVFVALISYNLYTICDIIEEAKKVK